MNRLIILSNRLPVNVVRDKDQLHLQPSVGGLATGLASYRKSSDCIWIGWPGVPREGLSTADRKGIQSQLQELKCVPVHLSASDVCDYYEGFSNKTLWPLFHYFQLFTIYEQSYWQAYCRVNQLFLDAASKVVRPDDTVWIHDYQLMLLPGLLREKFPDLSIGFFLHIPFPSFEVFRLLPWRRQILDGLLGADLIGFHTYDYVRHFLSSASRLAGLDHTTGQIQFGARQIQVDAFPMGIDYPKYARAVQSPRVNRFVRSFRAKTHRRKVILSVDRLDYTKGILQRLEAYDLFLTENPKYARKVVMIVLAVPSRTGVEHYEKLRNRVDQLVGRINGRHATFGWVPIWYMYRALSFERLTALYAVSDVALITPLRDGMNLIAKEYIAASSDGKGVLILSEMAGAASELPEALMVNANDKQAIAAAIREAIEMPEAEQERRNRLMQNRLSRYTVRRWARDFLDSLEAIKEKQKTIRSHKFNPRIQRMLAERYRTAEQRLLLLDYDGTLAPFASRPEQARPDAELLSLLTQLTRPRANTVVIISGRDRQTLEQWLGKLKLSLVAEHGAWHRDKYGEWICNAPPAMAWKKKIRPILNIFSDRTPGSSVEEKDFSLVWHFRRTDPALAQVRSQEIKDALRNMTANLGLGVFEGSKILEIKNLAIHKGTVTTKWLASRNWPFVLAAGDDYTDEDIFHAAQTRLFTIKIGTGPTRARFTIESVSRFRSVLKSLTLTH
ncbi:MAG: bifunctional alpha,alpha-trehalose-phosphate synthase (UDP-forming)/trehalose-phosphatase [Sedimentisphaerales bacterium]|nr:bifunctional alpha,alpha-trehalose-phosphate synthase (UDP-forming)/trehalose-phosphatase [Sedimentisphaerales bacterium]